MDTPGHCALQAGSAAASGAQAAGAWPLEAAVSRHRRALLAGAGGLLAVSVVGCGFKLRQAPTFAFQTLVAPLPDSSPLRRELKLALRSAGVTVLETVPAVNPAVAAGAPPVAMPDAMLEVLADQREKSVVGSTAAGQVREFQLRVRFRFRLSTLQGKVLIEDSEVLLQRDISYSETIALSKLEEEAEMYKDMQTDVVQQVMRRLAAVRSL